MYLDLFSSVPLYFCMCMCGNTHTYNGCRKNFNGFYTLRESILCQAVAEEMTVLRYLFLHQMLRGESMSLCKFGSCVLDMTCLKGTDES